MAGGPSLSTRRLRHCRAHRRGWRRGWLLRRRQAEHDAERGRRAERWRRLARRAPPGPGAEPTAAARVRRRAPAARAGEAASPTTGPTARAAPPAAAGRASRTGALPVSRRAGTRPSAAAVLVGAAPVAPSEVAAEEGTRAAALAATRTLRPPRARRPAAVADPSDSGANPAATNVSTGQWLGGLHLLDDAAGAAEGTMSKSKVKVIRRARRRRRRPASGPSTSAPRSRRNDRSSA